MIPRILSDKPCQPTFFAAADYEACAALMAEACREFGVEI